MSFRNDDYGNSYDDILKPCFKINPNVELKEVPTTGEEYLLKVVKERQKIKDVSECNIDVSKFAKNQNYFIEEEPEIEVAECFKPTLEWQKMQIADFSEVRLKVARIKQKKLFRLTASHFDASSFKQWRQFLSKNEPRLPVVLSFKSAKVDAGLEMITLLLKEIPHGKSIDHRLALWIYSLLACVTHPLLTETRCAVRGVAKKCREVRSHINPDDENAAEAVAPLNIFICLIARYFENEDLADR